MKYVGYGHDKPGPTDAEVAAKPTMSAYIVTENLECGTLKDKVLNQVLQLLWVCALSTSIVNAPLICHLHILVQFTCSFQAVCRHHTQFIGTIHSLQAPCTVVVGSGSNLVSVACCRWSIPARACTARRSLCSG